MGLTPKHFLRVAREHTYALRNPKFPCKNLQNPPDWMAARVRLGIMPTLGTGLAVVNEGEERSVTAPVRRKKPLRELEIVE